MKLCNDTANAAAFAREIDRSVYERLLNMPFAPPETGGIIGGRGGRILEAVIEERDADSAVCQYSPDVDFLNQVIAEWEKEGISFYGVFHSHPGHSARLSKGDMKYIETIMLAMPDRIDTLLFPVVLPKDRIVAYAARRSGSDVTVEEGELVVVQT